MIVNDTAADARTLRVDVVRIGTVDPRFARADVSARGVDSALAVLRRAGRDWKVIDFGTSNIGCRLPKRARVDLWIVCNGRRP